MARNHPHFNPGPGGYRPVSLYKGGKTETGGDSPKVIFGHSQKLISPEKSLSATVFISKVSYYALTVNSNSLHNTVRLVIIFT
jgi:hypothetical protein